METYFKEQGVKLSSLLYSSRLVYSTRTDESLCRRLAGEKDSA